MTTEITDTSETIETTEQLFEKGLERYRAGEAAADLIPLFKDVCDRSSKTASSWICLSWLYLLDKKPTLALKAAQKSVKLNPEDPQARINLAIALLDNSQSGVREHIEMAKTVLMVVPDMKAEIVENFEEGLRRRNNWSSLERVKKWIVED
jgi:tetratricopeptide (TPR) repeat protein